MIKIEYACAVFGGKGNVIFPHCIIMVYLSFVLLSSSVHFFRHLFFLVIFIEYSIGFSFLLMRLSHCQTVELFDGEQKHRRKINRKRYITHFKLRKRPPLFDFPDNELLENECRNETKAEVVKLPLSLKL